MRKTLIEQIQNELTNHHYTNCYNEILGKDTNAVIDDEIEVNIILHFGEVIYKPYPLEYEKKILSVFMNDFPKIEDSNNFNDFKDVDKIIRHALASNDIRYSRSEYQHDTENKLIRLDYEYYQIVC